MDALPIDPLLPELARALRTQPAVVLEAPPGAGKTTRVPRGLLDEGLLAHGECVVLEPRRLAARLAARRVAEELGEKPGQTVGWQVRFEDVSSAATRIRFVTEGVLTRRLLGDPQLRGVGVVLLDEFHERHLQGDLGLALLTRLQRTTRPDLKLVVMSATLEAGPVAAHLGNAPLLRSEGRRFDVALEYLEKPDDRHLHEQVATAVRRLVREGLDGDVLVFLPGAGEIRRAADTLAPLAQSADLLILPLHGELSPEEQDRAVRPANKRKIILSTNVAETSVTIDGIVAVVDSGLARIASHSPWTGLGTLRVGKVSRASATQRAGRAGRTRPGRCLRLYTKADFDQRPMHEESEIRRMDLAQTALELHAADIVPANLPWLEAPPGASLQAAEELLHALGALDGAGKITATGRRIARLPVHPRLGRLVVEAESRGAGRDGCLLAAILGERDLVERRGGPRKAATAVESDPVERVELFLEAESRGLSADAIRSIGLDSGAVRSVERARKQLERASGARNTASGWKATSEALRIALLAAFPDRVARRRTGAGQRLGARELVFAAGGAGSLSDESGVDAELVVAVDAEEVRQGTRGGVVVRSASAIEEEWLLDVVPDGLGEGIDVTWNASLERAEAWSRMRFGALVLDERKIEPTDSTVLSTRLHAEAKAAGVRAFANAEDVDRLVARVAFAAASFPEANIPAPDANVLDHALLALCEGRRSFAELREANLVEELTGRLVPDRRRFEQLAPDVVTLPGGRRAKVQYEPAKAPWLESRLQDFFGMKQGPMAGGRIPLVLHLLAPNQRAVQVTTDLAGFWQRHYPGIRQELMRRYPRHSWPDDPLTAAPPQRRS